MHVVVAVAFLRTAGVGHMLAWHAMLLFLGGFAVAHYLVVLLKLLERVVQRVDDPSFFRFLTEIKIGVVVVEAVGRSF